MSVQDDVQRLKDIMLGENMVPVELRWAPKTPTAEDVMAACEVSRRAYEIMREMDPDDLEESMPPVRHLRQATRLVGAWLDQFDPEK